MTVVGHPGRPTSHDKEELNRMAHEEFYKGPYTGQSYTGGSRNVQYYRLKIFANELEV
jgi:hypothetical protein